MTKVLFDTSVLVASLVAAHPSHAAAVRWHDRALRGRIGFLVASHTLAELYAVLSRLPVSPIITPLLARHLVEQNVGSRARIVTLGAADYRSVLENVAGLGLSGGIVYDALVARAAVKSSADVLLTLNADHFRRVWPDAGSRIRTP